MTLKQVDYKTKEENGNKYEATTYTLGENYMVEKYIRTYDSGATITDIQVGYKDWRKARENYLPEIHYLEDFFGKTEPRIEIQTTSYGALNPEEIKKVIAGYQEALEAAEILTKEFC